jgi:hypothetical protein
MCAQNAQCFSRSTGAGWTRERERERGNGKSTRARVSNNAHRPSGTQVIHPYPTDEERAGRAPGAWQGTSICWLPPPPSTHHHARVRRRRRGAGSGFPAGCLLHVMGWLARPCLTVHELLCPSVSCTWCGSACCWWFRVASNSTPA